MALPEMLGEPAVERLTERWLAAENLPTDAGARLAQLIEWAGREGIVLQLPFMRAVNFLFTVDGVVKTHAPNVSFAAIVGQIIQQRQSNLPQS